MKLGCFFGHVLDEGEAEFVFEVGFPELLVVVDVALELGVEQFLRGGRVTPASLVEKGRSSSVLILQEEAMFLTLSMPLRRSCSIS